MTLEELADLDADKLEALTDKELNEILTPFYTVTRPELVQKAAPKQLEPKAVVGEQLSPQKRMALELLKEAGVDVSFINKKKKK